MASPPTEPLASFEEFYAREFGRMVTLAVAVSGSRAAAEDIAQDALLQARRHWDRIAGYDNPGAWLRRVTIRLAGRRLRRARAEAAAFLRLGAPPPDLPPGPDEVEDVLRAVRRLPLRQRAAFRNLDARVAASAPEPRGPGRGWGVVPGIAAVAVVVVLVVAGLLLRPHGTAAPTLPAGPTPVSSSSSPSPINQPSQTRDEARRDGVPARIAALPLTARLAPVEPVTAGARVDVSSPEGLWIISRPNLTDLTDLTDPDDGCVPRTAGDLAYRACTDYSEVLLLTPDRTRVLRAWPVPDLPVQWLTLTDPAVYFGRQGDGGLPDSMIGRIDRSGHTMAGRVFPSGGPDRSSPRTFRGWRGGWSNAPRSNETGYDGVRLEYDGPLSVLDDTGRAWRTLDPFSLR